MKRAIGLATILLCLGLPLGDHVSVSVPDAFAQEPAPAPGPRTLPGILTLAREGRLGPVAFNHENHATKNYNISGTGLIACVECHHTAQPAAEVAKFPPLKTAWPADRTTTLTADLLAKSPEGVGLIACRSCHARPGTQPTVGTEIPQLKHEDSAAILNLTNQLAFHRNCSNCHDEVAKNRRDIKAPTSQQCTKCHKR